MGYWKKIDITPLLQCNAEIGRFTELSIGILYPTTHVLGKGNDCSTYSHDQKPAPQLDQAAKTDHSTDNDQQNSVNIEMQLHPAE
jgi:hypothetical protein